MPHLVAKAVEMESPGHCRPEELVFRGHSEGDAVIAVSEQARAIPRARGGGDRMVSGMSKPNCSMATARAASTVRAMALAYRR